LKTPEAGFASGVFFGKKQKPEHLTIPALDRLE